MIGETARVGARCTILHGVTLGGVGKSSTEITDAHCPSTFKVDNRRHPIIGDDVLLGCLAVVLGPICVGNGAKIGSSSVVLRSVPARCTAVGSPARIIGRSNVLSDSQGVVNSFISAAEVEQNQPHEDHYSNVYLQTWTLWADCIPLFDATASDPDATITFAEAVKLWAAKVNTPEKDMPVHVVLKEFRDKHVDLAHGVINAKELEVAIISHIKNIEDSYDYSYQI